MRALLGRLGVRGVVTAGLVILIVGVVVIGRLVGGSGRTPLGSPRVEVTLTEVPSSAPSADDGPVATSAAAFPDNGAVNEAAARFMNAWLQRTLSADAWHKAIAPLVTPTLSESLVGVDPAGVPATRIVGDATMTRRSDVYALVSVPVDTGTVQLTLIKLNGLWLVDGVDWERT